ncbi:hypothetical protein TYRP_018697 [Tyrophagus putrescentiae]|nr:hypothetical protein TYRP_018697 [Tyrophagus putrescentiae]
MSKIPMLAVTTISRLTLTTLEHCERPPTRTSLAPLARPSSAVVLDPRRRTLTTAKSRQTSPPWAVQCCPRNNCAPPAAQAEGDGSGSDSSERCDNGSDSTQRVTLSVSQHGNCRDSVPRLRTAAKASTTSSKTKDNVSNFLGFLVNHKEKDGTGLQKTIT